MNKVVTSGKLLPGEGEEDPTYEELVKVEAELETLQTTNEATDTESESIE